MFLNSAGRIRSSAKKIIATGPLSPIDLICAAGALPYDSSTHETIVHAVMDGNDGLVEEAVDAGLSPDFNPWNLVMVGAVVSGKNEIPINGFSTACGNGNDQIMKSWQIMAAATGKPSYLWEIPRYDADSKEYAINFLVKELEQLAKWLTGQTGQKVTDDALRSAVKRGNLLRQDMLEMTRLLQSSPVPIPALEYYITQTFIGDYVQDAEMLHWKYQSLLSELKNRVNRPTSTPWMAPRKQCRLYLVGEETQEFQFFNIIEDCGGVLVGCDSRLPLYYELVEEDGPIIQNLAEWIWNMPCNMPTEERIRVTLPHIREQKPDAIIISNTVGSRGLPGAERLVRDIFCNELGIPILSIETALPLERSEDIKSKLDTFIQQVGV